MIVVSDDSVGEVDPTPVLHVTHLPCHRSIVAAASAGRCSPPPCTWPTNGGSSTSSPRP